MTVADFAVEQLLHELLRGEMPDDALLGEEFGQLGEADRLWILDPIDGTSFFSRQDPNWRVHVALEVSGKTEIAVVTAPALGLQWWATRGGGTFEATWPRTGDGIRLSVSRTDQIEAAAIATLDPTSLDRLPAAAAVAPATPLPLVELIRGEIDGCLAEGFHVWDHAPWILLVQESGGAFTDRTGTSNGYAGGGMYSNRFLHDELVDAAGYLHHPHVPSDSA